ncbi:hypothetical protein Kpho02_72990 [Kitasatospora phosalacinea]|uniref:RNA polymerase sigma-70 region 2 domain-containing protein n=1 Tax=Kitasatospora phosalacinea TaxID=2065 RepID=A0A9W6V787_9ACTN|nr:sigma factor [Kitasatospora phosalacinea]GLW75002.1 hypothetical protein Kpho02_72990 [Kitasatospora phosalacinea]
MDIMPVPTESTVVEQFSATPAERFSAMYAEHRWLVEGIVRERLRRSDRQLAEDLVQETYLRLWTHLSAGLAVESETDLLILTARQAVAAHYRGGTSAEVSVNYTVSTGIARRLPSADPAEEIAVVRLVAAELLADVASGPTPLVLGAQVDGLMALAVAA